MSYPYKNHKEGASQQSRREPPNSNPFSPSKMQVGFPNSREDESFQKTLGGPQQARYQPSQKKVEYTIEEMPASEVQRSSYGQSQRDFGGQSQRSPMGQSQRYPMGQSQRDTFGQSQRDTMGQSTKYPTGQSQRDPFGQSQRDPMTQVVYPQSVTQAPQPTITTGQSQRTVPDFQPTRMPDTRSAGKSVIIRPGEPHHFGTTADVASGEVLLTLCRCSNTMSHGDAYTMLNSPRGKDIYGSPIDWQTAKMRMLDLYGKDQISHQEEVAAIPSIFDRGTAADMLVHEEDMKTFVRAGEEIVINTESNTTTWHNEDGHAKPYASADGGLRTKMDRSGYGQSYGGSRRG